MSLLDPGYKLDIPVHYFSHNLGQSQVMGLKFPVWKYPFVLKVCKNASKSVHTKQTKINMPNFIARFEFGFAFASLWVWVFFCWEERQTNRISLESVSPVCLSSSLSLCVCSPMFAARWRVSKGALDSHPQVKKEVRCSVQEFLVVDQLWHAQSVHKTWNYLTLYQCCVSLLRVRVTKYFLSCHLSTAALHSLACVLCIPSRPLPTPV